MKLRPDESNIRTHLAQRSPRGVLYSLSTPPQPEHGAALVDVAAATDESFLETFAADLALLRGNFRHCGILFVILNRYEPV